MLQISNRTRHAIALSCSVSAPPCAAVRRRTMLSLTCGPSPPKKLRSCITTTRLHSPQTVSVFASPSVFRSLSAAGVRASGRRGTGGSATLQERNRKVAIYMASVVAGVLGISYAAVPLYKAFCQMTGFGGTTQVADAEKAKKMSPVDGGRVIRVSFDGSVSDTMPWKFRPTQSDVRVVPGETALAFFTAKNPTAKHITGVATYNVFPLKAGIYFNKIQCFCFEEQRLRAGEEIDMPVFFFLDPEMLDDPAMDNVNSVTLSYTFFQTAEEDAVDEEEEEEEEEDGEQGEDEARGASAGGDVARGGEGQDGRDRDGAKRRWWVFSA